MFLFFAYCLKIILFPHYSCRSLYQANHTAVRGGLNENDIISIVGKSAFGESILSLPQKIKNEKWGLLTSDLKTPIKNKPQMPLTDMEKRWLRAVLDDPRVKLFDADIKGLENA